MRLIWSVRARVDLAHIHGFIGAKNPRAADVVVAEIVRAAKRLPAYPLLGWASDDVDVRLLQVPRRAYLLPYRIVEGDVEILAVFDERQERPEEWQ